MDLVALLTDSSYQQALAPLRDFALHAVQVIFGILLLREIYNLSTHGRTSYVPLLVRTFAAYIFIKYLFDIGSTLSHLTQSLNEGMHRLSRTFAFGSESPTFLDVVAYVFGQDQGINLLNLISLRGLTGLLSMLLLLAMALCKTLILDIVHPLLFILLLVAGYAAVPMRMFPEVDTLGGWLRTLLEVAIWPLVYGILVFLMSITFNDALEQASHLNIAGLFTEGVQQLADGAFGAQTVAPEQSLDEHLKTYFSFLGLCSGYCLLVLFTPFISGIIIRSAPVNTLGGIVSAKVAGTALRSVSSLGGIGGLASSGLSLFHAGSALNHDGSGNIKLDARQHPRPSERPQ